MNNQKAWISDLKDIFQSKWVIAFFLMMTSFLYDVFLFGKNGNFFCTDMYVFILCGYYFSWVVTLCFGRKVTVFCLILNFILFCVFKEYYKFHTLPLKLDMLLLLYKDGFIAGLKNISSLLDGVFIFCFILLLVQIKTVLFKTFYLFKKALVLFFVVVSLLFIYYRFVVWYAEVGTQVLYPNLFLSYQQGLLYKLKWPIEFFLPKDTQAYKSIYEGNASVRERMKTDDISLSFLPQHVYLIQAESLTTKSIDNMPFFQSLINDKSSTYFVDKNHEHCIGSANTDFMMMSGMTFDCTKTNTLIYYSYPVEIYNKINLLTQFFKNNGYQTIFFHGYNGGFYNRRVHYSKMMFDKLYFEEDFPKPLKRGHWGLGDYSFLKKISTRKVEDKSFYFIITSGMHPPYKVPEDEKNSLFGDENVDAYLNASSYFDNGLKELYFKAPDDSLFIIYGDHNVPELDAFDTPVLLTYKGYKILTINGEKETGFNGTVYFINSLFDERN